MGADNPNQLDDKPTIAELLADGEWDPGAYRSDTIMVHAHPGGPEARVHRLGPARLLRADLRREGDQHGANKINAAFSSYGPFGTLRTVENLAGCAWTTWRSSTSRGSVT